MTIVSNECPKTIRAMTVHAPFAYAMATGLKTEEYRYRSTNYRGWIFLHCGLSTASDTAFEYLDMEPKEANRGCIIGACFLNSCTQSGNCYAYQMITPVLFEKSLRIGGKQAILWLPSNSNEVAIFSSAWQELQRMIHTVK